MKPFRRAAIMLTVATSVAIAGGGPALAHETMPASGGGGLPGALVLTAAALVVLAGVGAVAMARRRSRPKPAQVAAVALVFTGVAHCALAPEHWREGWPLGLFFVLSGLLLLGQAAALWRNPSARVYVSIIASTAFLIVLYFLAREVTLPLVPDRDPYLFADLPVKAAELLAAALSIAALAPRNPGTLGYRPLAAAPTITT